MKVKKFTKTGNTKRLTMINNSFDFIELHKNGNCESVFYAFYGTKWVFGIYKMPFSYNKDDWEQYCFLLELESTSNVE
jgi:hypothetical protein